MLFIYFIGIPSASSYESIYLWFCHLIKVREDNERSGKKHIKLVRGRLLPVANDAVDSVALEISDVVVIVVVLAPAEDQEAGAFGFTHQRRLTK